MESTRRRMTPSTPKADFWELDALGARAMGIFGRASGARPGQAGCAGVPTEVCALGAGPRRASVHQKDAQPRIACEAPEQAGYPGLPSNCERPIYTEPGGNAESPADAAGPRCRRGARSVREPRVPEASAKPRATVGPKDAQPATPEPPIDAEPAVHAESPADAAGPRRGRGARSVREPRVPEASAEPRATARLRRAAVGPKDAQPSPADEAPGLLAEDSERSAVAAGPRGRRGSRSCRELQGGTLGRREATSKDWNPRPVLDKLRLKRAEISAAASVVNEVVGHLLRKVRKRESEFKDIELLNTGSYYEHVKISAPNEFDVMFKLQVPRIELQEYCNTGAYYFVKFKRLPKGNPLSQFLEEEILSASKMLSKFRKIIEEEVENIEGTNISVEEEKPGSPAVTLIIRNPKEISVDIILALESKGSWPASTKEGLPIERWLGRKVRTKLRLEPFYLVPKNAKEGDGFQGKTWRLSFSHTEKYILNNHGADKTCCETDGVKCCRKECLKLMKCLLEQLKKEFTELDKFCSYHVKTAIFHMWTEKPQDSEWDRKHLRSCFLDFVTYFVECLNTEKLDHFFIPKFNLFSQELVDTKSKEFLSKKIEYERNNRFPIFDKF